MADGGFEPGDLNRLMVDLRPRLHRYCARMVGSAFEGEDIVQDALAKAVAAFPAVGQIEHPESWLFRIAHNAALDALRRKKREAATRAYVDLADQPDPANTADARVAATASLAVLMALSVVQRSSVVLVDVLGHSMDEAVAILGVSLSALKSALRRGRVNLRKVVDRPDASLPFMSTTERDRLRAYADRFNSRDFDALRAMLAEDVRLDLANRLQLNGRKEVSVYFGRYDGQSDWRFSLGWAEGQPALLVSDPADPSAAVSYVVLLGWADGQVRAIRDFRYAGYVMDSLTVSRLP